MNQLFILAGLGAAVWWFSTQNGAARGPGPAGLVPKAAAMPPGGGLGGLYPGGYAQQKQHEAWNILRHAAGLPTMGRVEWLALPPPMRTVPEGPDTLVGEMP